MTRFGIVVVALALICAVGCDSSDDVTMDTITGSYAYTAQDTTGTVVLEGLVTLNASTNPMVVGDWEIDWAPGADTSQVVGPQIGSGELMGTTGENGLRLDLNPLVSDDNVILQCDMMSTGPIGGTWTYSTLLGVTATGEFVLERMP